jgi:hypothetical protein
MHHSVAWHTCLELFSLRDDRFRPTRLDVCRAPHQENSIDHFVGVRVGIHCLYATVEAQSVMAGRLHSGQSRPAALGRKKTRDLLRSGNRYEVRMFGVGGTSPKTKAAKVVWWLVFSLFSLFIGYVLVKNRHNF